MKTKKASLKLEETEVPTPYQLEDLTLLYGASGSFGTVLSVNADPNMVVKVMSIAHNEDLQHAEAEVLFQKKLSKKGVAPKVFNSFVIKVESEADLWEGVDRQEENGLEFPFYRYMFEQERMFDSLYQDKENFVELGLRKQIVLIIDLFLKLSTIHSSRVCVNDIKPENLMVVNEEISEIKFIDFGLSATFDEQIGLQTFFTGHPMKINFIEFKKYQFYRKEKDFQKNKVLKEFEEISKMLKKQKSKYKEFIQYLKSVKPTKEEIDKEMDIELELSNLESENHQNKMDFENELVLKKYKRVGDLKAGPWMDVYALAVSLVLSLGPNELEENLLKCSNYDGYDYRPALEDKDIFKFSRRCFEQIRKGAQLIDGVSPKLDRKVEKCKTLSCVFLSAIRWDPRDIPSAFSIQKTLKKIYFDNWGAFTKEEESLFNNQTFKGAKSNFTPAEQKDFDKMFEIEKLIKENRRKQLLRNKRAMDTEASKASKKELPSLIGDFSKIMKRSNSIYIPSQRFGDVQKKEELSKGSKIRVLGLASDYLNTEQKTTCKIVPELKKINNLI